MTNRIKLPAVALGVTLVAGLVLSAILWIGYTKLKGYSSNPLTYSSCVTETQAEFHDLAGWDFEAEDTSSDTLAKDEEVRVFAVAAHAKNSRLGRFLARRRLIFAYDPGTMGVEGLTVEAKDARRIQISLQRASEVFEKKRTLGKLAIEYDIGVVDYQ
jgi:hypothetical protein